VSAIWAGQSTDWEATRRQSPADRRDNKGAVGQ
jgi:hypothetical protein